MIFRQNAVNLYKTIRRYVTGALRSNENLKKIIQNDEVQNLAVLSRLYDDEIKGYEMGRECSRRGRKHKYVKALDTKLEGNSPVGKI
jgi:hypothetical protein